jgi:hypothetical protein
MSTTSEAVCGKASGRWYWLGIKLRIERTRVYKDADRRCVGTARRIGVADPCQGSSPDSLSRHSPATYRMQYWSSTILRNLVDLQTKGPSTLWRKVPLNCRRTWRGDSFVGVGNSVENHFLDQCNAVIH